MANLKISALTSATTPLAGTEVLPIVQSSATVKVATNDLTVRNIRANATTGILQVTGPTAASTRVMTTPDANFTTARTDAAQSFTGNQTISNGNLVINNSTKGITTGSAIALGLGINNAVNTVTIDSTGRFLVGTTSITTTDQGCFASAQNSLNTLSCVSTDDASGGNFIMFRNSAYTTIGSVSRVTTTNAVVYNTTSDYRLKNVVGDVSGSGERIDALKPIDYEWKDGGQKARGFLAHEFQTVYPNSVNGSKDAVDANGNPVYQAMQASTAEVIADLVAEIQLLRKRLTIIENK